MARNLLDKAFYIRYLETCEIGENRGRKAASQGAEMIYQGANRVGYL